MSPALNGSSTPERFKCSNVSEIRNGIMFDFYPGLPHMYNRCMDMTFCKLLMGGYLLGTMYEMRSHSYHMSMCTVSQHWHTCLVFNTWHVQPTTVLTQATRVSSRSAPTCQGMYVINLALFSGLSIRSNFWLFRAIGHWTLDIGHWRCSVEGVEAWTVCVGQ